MLNESILQSQARSSNRTMNQELDLDGQHHQTNKSYGAADKCLGAFQSPIKKEHGFQELNELSSINENEMNLGPSALRDALQLNVNEGHFKSQ